MEKKVIKVQSASEYDGFVMYIGTFEVGSKAYVYDKEEVQAYACTVMACYDTNDESCGAFDPCSGHYSGEVITDNGAWLVNLEIDEALDDVDFEYEYYC